MNFKNSLFLGLLFSCPALLNAYDWKNPNPEEAISYIYVPGVGTNEMYMASHCPRFVASTGELITCSKGIEVIGLPASCPNMTEIKLTKPELPDSESRVFSSVARFFVQGFEYVSSALVSKSMGFNVEKPSHVAKNEQYDSVAQHWVHEKEVNLGQEDDLKILKKHYQEHVAKQENAQKEAKDKAKKVGVVLYGTSRGASAIYNFAALEKVEEVKALVCESIFDSLENVSKFTTSTRISKTVLYLPEHTNFKHEGILPIRLLDKIAKKDLPILLVTSHADITVPEECTMNMYNGLRTAGYNNVHILILDKADHGFYPYASDEETARYQSVVHAFYKHYGLPYIEEYADRGHAWFATQTQPLFKAATNLPK